MSTARTTKISTQTSKQGPKFSKLFQKFWPSVFLSFVLVIWFGQAICALAFLFIFSCFARISSNVLVTETLSL